MKSICSNSRAATIIFLDYRNLCAPGEITRCVEKVFTASFRFFYRVDFLKSITLIYYMYVRKKTDYRQVFSEAKTRLNKMYKKN